MPGFNQTGSPYVRLDVPNNVFTVIQNFSQPWDLTFTNKSNWYLLITSNKATLHVREVLGSL
jgi:hypothetical protein